MCNAERRNFLSTLEKTIDLLGGLSENQIETIYRFVQFLSTQPVVETQDTAESLEDIFDQIVGVVPDTGKTLEDYRKERIKERYEAVN